MGVGVVGKERRKGSGDELRIFLSDDDALAIILIFCDFFLNRKISIFHGTIQGRILLWGEKGAIEK